MGTHDVTIIIGTFGADRWTELARQRALPSTEGQGAEAVYLRHGQTLRSARNGGAKVAHTEWLCFLDADDELEPGYLDALMAADGDLRAPAIRYVHGSDALAPVVLSDRNIDKTNPCVIGTLIRRATFHKAGGFWAERAWEDWSLFRRATLLGATISHTPAAVYRVHVDPAGRNSTVAQPRTLHREILASHDRWERTRRDRTARDDRRKA